MRAKLRVELRNGDGTVVTSRSASNVVLMSGGELIANLFSGAGNPVNHMSVGTSDAEPGSVTVTALKNGAEDGTGALTGRTSVELAGGSFATTVDKDHRRVVVRIRATLPNDAAVGTVREAALASHQEGETDVLYNRVVFAPVEKGDDHDLTLFWEVEFPFGDLQWLVR